MSASSKNANGRENLLSEFKDRLVAIYSQALMSTVKEEVSFRLIAAHGLLLLSKIRSLLPDDEIGLCRATFRRCHTERRNHIVGMS